MRNTKPEMKRSDMEMRRRDVEMKGRPMVGPRPIMPRPMGPGVPVKPMVRPTVPAMKKGGSVSSASKRADGCAVKGKTKGKMV